MYRKTYLKVNLDHLYENYSMIQKKVGEKIVIPVVKANAYGHGVFEVVDKLYQNGVDFFAVSLLEEAIELRNKYPNIKLLMMGVCNHGDFDIAASYQIQVTVGNNKQLEEVLQMDRELLIHLKIDTGMNRLGFKDLTDAKNAFVKIQQHSNAKLVGVYTHFATADNDYPYFVSQKEKFEQFLSMIDHRNMMIHVSNSSSAIKYEGDLPYTTHIRLGISLYGLTLDKETDFLKNTCKLITHISEVKYLTYGEKLGYGATYQAQKNEKIAILPIGYADGFIRKNQGGYVEIDGNRCEIIGRICMDQMFVRIKDNINIDTPVVLFGGLITIDEVANRLDTINYEVICQVTSRVPRVYK